MNRWTPSQQTLAVFAGVASVLLLASMLGWWLRRRVARGQAHPAIDNLNARIGAWWVMVAAMAVAFTVGPHGVLALFFFVSWMALREFFGTSDTRGADRWASASCFVVLLPLQYLLIAVDGHGLSAVLIPVSACVLLPTLLLLSSDTTRFLERAARLQWAVMVCVVCISHVPALLTLHLPGHEGRQTLLIAFLLLVVQGSDVLQYVWGKLAGRRPLAPRLSPSKTVEGLVGGVASASLLGMSLWWITPFTPMQAGAMALAVCTMGFLGGLVMSAIKRDRGIKDWGRMIDGHGGMLDRLDSVCFAAPVFFYLVRHGWT